VSGAAPPSPGTDLGDAGLADIFPKGTPIGTVVSVEDSKDTFFKDVRLKPAADIGNLEEVLVIAAAPGAPAPPEETKKKAKLR